MRKPKQGWEAYCEHSNEVALADPCTCPEECGCRYYSCKIFVETVSKIEGDLKSALMVEVKLQLPRFVALRHEDVRTAGIPDLSLTGYNRTSWWEFKHATPRFVSPGIQELTMKRLASAGYARYVIWMEDAYGRNKRTLVVHPKHIHPEDLQPVDCCVGFNHRWLTDFMHEVHNP